MAATRLAIYQAALRHIGERTIQALTDNSEGRRKLDDVWNNDGVNRCLELGLWRFATRSSELFYDQNVQTSFGYGYAFQKPTDYLKAINVAADEFFQQPLIRYSDEQGFIFCDLQQIYVRYVSNNAQFGQNLSLWTGAFTRMVEWYFANEICLKVTNDPKRAALIQDPSNPNRGYYPAALLAARNLDAWADPVKFPARGNWVNSRIRMGANSGSWNDMGNQGQLIG